jgi:hypothetical protein
VAWCGVVCNEEQRTVFAAYMIHTQSGSLRRRCTMSHKARPCSRHVSGSVSRCVRLALMAYSKAVSIPPLAPRVSLRCAVVCSVQSCGAVTCRAMCRRGFRFELGQLEHVLQHLYCEVIWCHQVFSSSWSNAWCPRSLAHSASQRLSVKVAGTMASCRSSRSLIV